MLGQHVPFLLLDCFRLVTPLVCDAFGAAWAADNGRCAALLTFVGIFGEGSGTFTLSSSAGDAMVAVSAIGH